jgi:RNA polymerase sigma factor for flagellar operon FliA
MIDKNLDRAALIERYKQSGEKTYRNEAVLKYMDVVKFHVFNLKNMYDGYIDPEEITNEAVIGLINAVEDFDITKNVKFETYASVVVRGAIIDYIRKSNAVPHRLGRFYKDLQQTYQVLYTKYGREPTNTEVADAMYMDEEDVRKKLIRFTSYHTTSLDEYLSSRLDVSEVPSDEGVWQIEESSVRDAKIEALTAAIEQLGTRDRTVVTLYYYEGLNLAAIGDVLDLTEARASQLLTNAVRELRMLMDDYTD